MKFYIARASEDQLESGDLDLFESSEGSLYNYEVEFDGETVRLTDTIGRMVPFDVTELDTLIQMLSRINSFYKNTESANAFLYNRLIEGSEPF
jgi:hypothetical protein